MNRYLSEGIKFTDKEIIEHENNIESEEGRSPYQVVAIFSENPESNAKSIGERFGIPIIVKDMAEFYRKKGEPRRNLEIRKELGKTRGVANCLNSVGAVYKELGAYVKAIDYYEQSLKLKKDLEDRQGIAISLNNIGELYSLLGDYQKALEYQQKSIAIYEEILDPKHPNLGISYSNIAVTYMLIKDFSAALTYQKKAVEIFKSVLPENHPYRQGASDTLEEIIKAMEGKNE
ncbi:MAG: tetratricopeptide repeat protein [Bacteroidetes bacterium]|nr:tetratricopeptide repeat protein [Bacteroidota bacterium]